MDTLGKAKLTASMHHIARLLKSGIPIYNSTVQDMAGRKVRRRGSRTYAIVKRYAFYATQETHKKVIHKIAKNFYINFGK